MAHVVSLISSLMSLGSMLHVNFEKWPCRRVDLRGQGPLECEVYVTLCRLGQTEGHIGDVGC